MKYTLSILFLTGISIHFATAQFQTLDETPFFAGSTATGPRASEHLVFEARPILRLNFFGNFNSDLQEADSCSNKLDLAFDPQIRMYHVHSNPVRMPSYRVFLSYSHLWDLGGHNLFSVAVEHGHYSNGQEGTEFGTNANSDSINNDVYSHLQSIEPSQYLNRKSGEFSTNFMRTRLKFSLDASSINNIQYEAVEFEFMFTRLMTGLYFSTMGGLEDKNRHLYPMNQYHFELAYSKFIIENERHNRLRFGVECFYKPSEVTSITSFNVAPFIQYYGLFDIIPFGVLLKYEYGQDSYNIRFVDRINRVLLGFNWYLDDMEKWKQFRY